MQSSSSGGGEREKNEWARGNDEKNARAIGAKEVRWAKEMCAGKKMNVTPKKMGSRGRRWGEERRDVNI